jgi:hypothetical protein
MIYEVATDLRDAFKNGATEYSLRRVVHNHSRLNQASAFYIDVGLLCALGLLGAFCFAVGSNKVFQLVSNFWKS